MGFSSCVLYSARDSLPFPLGQGVRGTAQPLFVSVKKGQHWQSSSYFLHCVQTHVFVCFLTAFWIFFFRRPEFSSNTGYLPKLALSTSSLATAKRVWGRFAGSSGPTAFSEVCLPVNICTGRQESSWVPWCIVLDPTSSTRRFYSWMKA